MTIEPSVFWAGLGAIAAAIAFAIREYFISRSYTNKSNANNDKTAVDTLADIARQGVTVQQHMVDAVNNMAKTNAETSAHIAGMVRMQDDHTKIIRAAVLTIDEVATVLPKIKTDVEGITAQFAPIVSALSNIGAQLTQLVQTVQAKDGEVNSRLSALIEDFRSAESRLMKALEPIVLKHIGELTHETSDNHKSV